MIDTRTILTAAIATTCLGCAAAPPCSPVTPLPAPIAKTDYPECSGDGTSRFGASAVVGYAAGAADSMGRPDRIIAGPHTGLCGPTAIAQGPNGELYVLNHAPWN